MSEDSDSKPYSFLPMENQDGASACRAANSCGTMPRGASSCPTMGQLRRMSGYSQGGADLGLPSEGSDSSSQDRAASPQKHRKNTRTRLLPEEDVEMKSSGSSGSGTESHGNESHGNDSHGNDSNGLESAGSSNGTSKDSALLESSGSNKSSNSHSSSPPSSSNAFSLLSSEQDNPSTSGCSSQESAKAKTQKELFKTLKELKAHLPAEKCLNNKSSTLSTLKYALRCVKQVEANEEYYQLLMVNDSQPSGPDVSSYTIDEIDSITSEYTLKNNDIFAVAVSLITGRIVYISDQAASILNCKPEVFTNAKFVEFLIPQDVSVFYSFTTPYRLPSWSMCTGAESSPPDCMQEKSFFCRISGGKEREGDLQYYPFRMTPYLMKVQVSMHAEDQFCCLLLAERVHSGYDAPRIPTDKRVFTTTHTPSCVFQDVDERAVPLLGYLPQDLIGTPVLLHLHPNDRPIMLAIHRKIVQCAGQPFDHSSIRFCARNGEYIILDTSWSSFVNPWSRKVSFVIGRHKVRMGPVNEDVFVPRASTLAEIKSSDSDIQEITEQIHRMLLQPVHTGNSSGYGSFSSKDHLLGMTSSSDSLNADNRIKMVGQEEELSNKARPRTFQEICKGVQIQKSQEQQNIKADSKKVNSIESGQKSSAAVRPKQAPAPPNWKETETDCSRSSFQEDLGVNDQAVYSYQQISCLDSVIRYLENCNVPVGLKRKCQSPCNTASSNSDEDQPRDSSRAQVSGEPALLKDQSCLTTLEDPDKKSNGAATAVVGTSLPLPLPNKPESVVSITSQCSYSSTIVHVGDKKPQPESEIVEDVSGAGETVESSPNTSAPPCAVTPPSQERESYKKLGLTKQVLAAHTQKEEQAFLFRFREHRELSALKANCSQYLERRREKMVSDAVPAARALRQSGRAQEPTARQGGRNRKTKLKRPKHSESSDSTASYHRHQQTRPALHQPSSRAPSQASQAAFPMAYPGVMPGYQLPVYPGAAPMPSHPDNPSFCDNQSVPMPACLPAIHPAAYPAPMMTPFVAVVLPNYVYPPMAPGPSFGFPRQTQFAPFPLQGAIPGPPMLIGQNQFAPQRPFVPVTPTAYCHPSSETPKANMEGHSRSSTPQSGGRPAQASPPLFQSRCSSPLNLLELELSVDRQDSGALPSGAQGIPTAEKAASVAQTKDINQPSLTPHGPSGPLYFVGMSSACEGLSWNKEFSRLSSCSKEASSRGDGNNSDANSLSSDMLDILLQEDSYSGTGSATSGSMGSGSNGCGTSGSGKSKSGTSQSATSGCGSGSNNSSNYFGSVDSSQNSQKVKGHMSNSRSAETGEDFNKFPRRDPMWLIMANTDDKLMMTYQLPTRDVQKVLREDLEKLRQLQKNQPRFTEEQRKEVITVHPWIKDGGRPKVVEATMCSCCTSATEAPELMQDQPDLDSEDVTPEERHCPQLFRADSTNTVMSCHVAPAVSTSFQPHTRQ